ncbi:MAG: hypothetical protein HQL30_02610 [Candidatus Omnitrophica bacterium]|nr:hypothetical protein [Candidatus Omnitrophota bacterium]
MFGKILWLSIILLAGYAGGTALAVEPKINAFSDKKEIGVGEKIKVTVEMEWKDEGGPSISVTRITPPGSPLLEQIDSKQSSSSRLTKDGVFSRTFLEYLYIGKEKGSGEATPAVLEYVSGSDKENIRMVKTPPIPVRIISRAARSGKIALEGFLIILAALLILGVSAILIRNLGAASTKKRNRGPNKDNFEAEKKVIAHLRDIDRHRIAGETGEYYYSLQKAMEGYVKKKYPLGLESELPGDLRSLYNECGEMALKVRFSGYGPTENEQERLARGIARYMKALIPCDNVDELIETVDSKEG